jgi:PPM family protein phosphatase
MIVKGKIVGVNVGDSRIYSISSGKRNAQMTQDDNLASYIGRHDGQAANSGEKGLVQFVGMGDGIEPHIVTPHERDIASILITSDGVHDAPPEAIAQIVQVSRSSLDMVQRLLSLSGILGGRDNATALVVPANLNLGKISERGITIACVSPFDDLEIWIPITENALVESDDADQKLQAQDAEVTQSNFKERKTHYRQKKIKSRRKKAAEEAKLPLDEERPPLNISFPAKKS